MLNLGAVTAGGQHTHIWCRGTQSTSEQDPDWSVVAGRTPAECNLLQKHAYMHSVMLLTWFQRRPPRFLNQVVRVFPLTQFVLARAGRGGERSASAAGRTGRLSLRLSGQQTHHYFNSKCFYFIEPDERWKEMTNATLDFQFWKKSYTTCALCTS